MSKDIGFVDPESQQLAPTTMNLENKVAVSLSYTTASAFVYLWQGFMQMGTNKQKLRNWLKRLGFWGFLFFLAKGIFWLVFIYFLKECN